MVFRACKKNLYWQEISSEKIEYYSQGIQFLEDAGYHFKSFTIDGRKGVISLLRSKYPNIPLQFCVFHQKAIVCRYITDNPKTDCGKRLKELIYSLTKTNRDTFTQQLDILKEQYNDFLKEKNNTGQFVHRRLRSAIRSVTVNLPYLFTYKDYPHLSIPNTTNTCDGSFAHWKQKIKIHRGLSKKNRYKMICFFLENT